ncbi:hypothetical protein HDV00_008051 [Rhizophlyctis rosea]|nr:hypothetical protein HDV00_008051 [Rhizophlyctis rosea]
MNDVQDALNEDKQPNLDTPISSRSIHKISPQSRKYLDSVTGRAVRGGRDSGSAILQSSPESPSRPPSLLYHHSGIHDSISVAIDKANRSIDLSKIVRKDWKAVQNQIFGTTLRGPNGRFTRGHSSSPDQDSHGHNHRENRDERGLERDRDIDSRADAKDGDNRENKDGRERQGGGFNRRNVSNSRREDFHNAQDEDWGRDWDIRSHNAQDEDQGRDRDIRRRSIDEPLDRRMRDNDRDHLRRRLPLRDPVNNCCNDRNDRDNRNDNRNGTRDRDQNFRGNNRQNDRDNRNRGGVTKLDALQPQFDYSDVENRSAMSTGGQSQLVRRRSLRRDESMPVFRSRQDRWKPEEKGLEVHAKSNPTEFGLDDVSSEVGEGAEGVDGKRDRAGKNRRRKERQLQKHARVSSPPPQRMTSPSASHIKHSSPFCPPSHPTRPHPLPTLPPRRTSPSPASSSLPASRRTSAPMPSRLLAVGPGFASFERHTTGIGSRLMAKMGFVKGTGLGKNEDGLTEPLEAAVPEMVKRMEERRGREVREVDVRNGGRRRR